MFQSVSNTVSLKLNLLISPPPNLLFPILMSDTAIYLLAHCRNLGFSFYSFVFIPNTQSISRSFRILFHLCLLIPTTFLHFHNYCPLRATLISQPGILVASSLSFPLGLFLSSTFPTWQLDRFFSKIQVWICHAFILHPSIIITLLWIKITLSLQ